MVKPRRRKCVHCKVWFVPVREGQLVCTIECASAHGRLLTAKARAKAEQLAKQRQRDQQKKERAAWRERKAIAKPLSHWIEMTQRAVNDVVRETALANGEGCISCGTHQSVAWQAGHYRTTAAAPQLRFNRNNIHLQCNHCNVYKSGNIEMYRANLVSKIGEVGVLALENNHEIHRYTREELADIRAGARAELRALKSGEPYEPSIPRICA